MTRFTADRVHAIADAAKELTGGAFSMNGVSHPGDGTIIHDGVASLSWHGRNATREAAAYYAGAALAWAELENVPVPAVIAEVAPELEHAGGAVSTWFVRGQKIARARYEVRTSR